MITIPSIEKRSIAAEIREGDIRVARAMVDQEGARAPAICRHIAARCEAREDYQTRDTYLRWARLAEKELSPKRHRWCLFWRR